MMIDEEDIQEIMDNSIKYLYKEEYSPVFCLLKDVQKLLKSFRSEKKELEMKIETLQSMVQAHASGVQNVYSRFQEIEKYFNNKIDDMYGFYMKLDKRKKYQL